MVYNIKVPNYLFVRVDVEVAFVYVVNLYCACKNKNNKFKKNNIWKNSLEIEHFFIHEY